MQLSREIFNHFLPLPRTAWKPSPEADAWGTAPRSQLASDDLTADGLRELFFELHNSRILIRRGMLLDVVLDFLLQLLRALGALDEHDAGLDDLPAHYGAIDAGKVDVLGIQVAITDAIKDKYDFSSRYAYNVIRMVSLKDKPYESLADLAGKKICIAPGKLSEFFEGYNEKNPGKEIELVTTEGNIYEELDLGRFEAFPMTIMAFEKMQREGKADPYKMFGEAVITEENVFPINKDVPEDVQKGINDAIEEMLSDGTLAQISEKWYYRDVTKPFEE